MKLGELAGRLGCELVGDAEVELRGVGGLEQAGPGDLTFLANPRYAPRLATTRASAVVVAPGQDTSLPRLVSDNPYLTFARAVDLLSPTRRPEPGVDASARVHPTAVLGAGVHVGALAVVGARARVGARSILHPQVIVYHDAVIGEDCLLHAGVQLRERCRLGDRVVVQNGAVIGADGFGFVRDGEGRYRKIPQVGVVVIEDDVEIGALTAIDRASLGETRIGAGCKLDNLVQVGHSVRVGPDSVLCAQVGVAGSSRIGRGVTLAGQVGVADHATVGDGAIATAQSGIASAVKAKAVVSGTPVIENRTWLRSAAVFARLPELHRRVRELERKLETLLAKSTVSG